MLKKNKAIILIVVILTAIALILVLNRDKSTFSKKDYDFAVADTGSITKIYLVNKSNQSVLFEKQSVGNWLLNGKHKAHNYGINMLLETMTKITAKAPVPKKGHNNVISQLATASTKVEIYQEVYRINLFDKIKLFKHEKLTKTYYVGNPTPDNMGTFMLLEGADIPFIVHILGFRGFVSSRFSVVERDWRDHTVFRAKLAEIKSLTMEIPETPEKSFKIILDGNRFAIQQLSDKQNLPAYDTLKLLNFLTSFADLRFEALLNEIDASRIDSITHSIPKEIITLVKVNGDTTKVKTFFKPNDARKYDMEGGLYVHDLDRLYGLINNDEDFVLMQYFVFDKILKDIDYFKVQ
jgi:hypothetical protein